jgi:hypothetical protein
VSSKSRQDSPTGKRRPLACPISPFAPDRCRSGIGRHPDGWFRPHHPRSQPTNPSISASSPSMDGFERITPGHSRSTNPSPARSERGARIVTQASLSDREVSAWGLHADQELNGGRQRCHRRTAPVSAGFAARRLVRISSFTSDRQVMLTRTKAAARGPRARRRQIEVQPEVRISSPSASRARPAQRSTPGVALSDAIRPCIGVPSTSAIAPRAA